MRKLLFVALIGILVLASCSKQKEDLPGSNEVLIRVEGVSKDGSVTYSPVTLVRMN